LLFFFTHYLHITQALDEGAALALAAELDEKGEAMVGGFKILKDMVTIKKVSKGLKRSGSCSSMASSTGTSTTGGGALSRSGSALSLSSAVSSAVSASGALSRNGSAISLSSVDSGDSMPAAFIQKVSNYITKRNSNLNTIINTKDSNISNYVCRRLSSRILRWSRRRWRVWGRRGRR